jgi:hypothetical protein
MTRPITLTITLTLPLTLTFLGDCWNISPIFNFKLTCPVGVEDSTQVVTSGDKVRVRVRVRVGVREDLTLVMSSGDKVSQG